MQEYEYIMEEMETWEYQVHGYEDEVAIENVVVYSSAPCSNIPVVVFIPICPGESAVKKGIPKVKAGLDGTGSWGLHRVRPQLAQVEKAHIVVDDFVVQPS